MCNDGRGPVGTTLSTSSSSVAAATFIATLSRTPVCNDGDHSKASLSAHPTQVGREPIGVVIARRFRRVLNCRRYWRRDSIPTAHFVVSNQHRGSNNRTAFMPSANDRSGTTSNVSPSPFAATSRLFPVPLHVLLDNVCLLRREQRHHRLFRCSSQRGLTGCRAQMLTSVLKIYTRCAIVNTLRIGQFATMPTCVRCPPATTPVYESRLGMTPCPENGRAINIP